jgi:hypothetical protein
VAENESLSKQIGLTPGKAALMGVLGVALMGVIYIQFGSSGTADLAPASERPSRRPVVTRTAAKQPSAQSTNATEATTVETAVIEFDQSQWKSPELSTVVAYDPFALPAAFPQPQITTADLMVDGGRGALAAASAEQLANELDRLQSQLEELKNRGVHVIMSVDGQYVAMIGDRMVHVGDEINEFTVTDIDPNGVRVERKQVP